MTFRWIIFGYTSNHALTICAIREHVSLTEDCESEPVSDDVGSFDMNAGGKIAFASRLAPTGGRIKVGTIPGVR